MKTWTTLIYAIDPVDNEHKEFAGPNIEAPSSWLAHEYCQKNGLGYCHIGGELIMEIPCDEHNNPDWSKQVDYETIQNN